MKRTLILTALALPTLILGAWTTKLVILHKTANEYEVVISGYDPRDLLMGQYIAFQYDWETAKPPITPIPDIHTGRYYVSEKKAPILEDMLQHSKQKFSVRIHFDGDEPQIRELLINGKPWDDYLDQ